jgi:calnexin
MKRNPDYKGKWTAPYVENPAYKGTWAPRKIKNPNYFEDKTPANFEPMGAIGFEIWTMQNDILFDNIYIGHSIEDANKLAEETFGVKHPLEKALAEADRPKQDDKPRSPSDLNFMEDPVHYITEKIDLFKAIAAQDPIQAIKFVPEVAGGFAAIILAAAGLIAVLFNLGKSSPAVQQTAEKAANKAKQVKDKAAEASATGAEKVKGEVNKRTTRSQS